MKSFFAKITRIPLIITVLLLTAAILLACGPASQTQPQTEPVSQAIAKDGEPEPTLEPTPEPPKYPNLDATLQEIVARFEAEELSESAAATQAHTYHGSSVLVTVDLSANIDAVDAWMEGRDISSRHTNATHIPPNIDAFVKVSLLGALSQQEGIIQVKESVPPWAESPSGQDPGGGSGARGASGGTGAEGPSGDATGPRLPIWLKGHPYHNLDSELTGLVDLYERGELTEAEAAARTDGHRGSSVAVVVDLVSGDPANTDAVAAWLASRVLRSKIYLRKRAPSEPTCRCLCWGPFPGSPALSGYLPQDLPICRARKTPGRGPRRSPMFRRRRPYPLPRLCQRQSAKGWRRTATPWL